MWTSLLFNPVGHSLKFTKPTDLKEMTLHCISSRLDMVTTQTVDTFKNIQTYCCKMTLINFVRPLWTAFKFQQVSLYRFQSVHRTGPLCAALSWKRHMTDPSRLHGTHVPCNLEGSVMCCDWWMSVHAYKPYQTYYVKYHTHRMVIKTECGPECIF